MAAHTIFGGKVHVYKRPNSRFWQCSTYLAGRGRRIVQPAVFDSAITPINVTAREEPRPLIVVTSDSAQT